MHWNIRYLMKKVVYTEHLNHVNHKVEKNKKVNEILKIY